jgi:hypothetical protein
MRLLRATPLIRSSEPGCTRPLGTVKVASVAVIVAGAADPVRQQGTQMTTTFEVLSFEDMADAGPRSDAAIDAMALPQLRVAAREDIRAVAGAAGVPVAKVEVRIRKLFKVKALGEADLHDLRAMLREMRVWIGRPAVFRTPAPRSAKVSQPEGAGRMARPGWPSAPSRTPCAACAPIWWPPVNSSAGCAAPWRCRTR